MNWEPAPEEPSGFAGDFRANRPRIESPASWSLPLMRLGPVSVRVHAAFLLLIAVESLRASLPGSPRTLAFGPTLVALAALLLLSVVHEFGRWLAHRRSGGDLDEWLLWPLGGLAGAAPPEDGVQRSGPELAGLGAVAVIGLVNGGLLAWTTGDALGSMLPAPWSLDGFAQLSLSGAGSAAETQWLLQWSVMVVLALNAIPAFPLDGGRALAARLVARRGWSAGLSLVSRLSTVCAVALLVAGLGWGAWTLTLLSLVVWSSARETIVRVGASDESLEPEPRGRSEPVPGDQAELDRILEKINRDGMGSLSFLERRRLRAATRRRRGDDH